MTRTMGNAYMFERLGNPALAFTGADPPINQGHLDILGNAEIIDKVETLEDETDCTSAQDREVLLGCARDILAQEPEGTARGAVEQPQDVEQCGFPAA